MSTNPTDLPLLLSSTDDTNSAPTTPPAEGPQARRLAGTLGEPRTTTAPATQPRLNGTTPTPVAASDSAESPTFHPRAEPDLDAEPAEHGVVSQIQIEVSDQLTSGREGRALTEDDAPRARALIRDEVDAHNQRLLKAGTPALNPRQRTVLGEAVYNALFEFGPLTPLLQRPGLTDLMIRGGGHVHLDFEDGHSEVLPPIAANDDELIAIIRRLSRKDTVERPFDRANPTLDMPLPGDFRLSAQAWFSPYPMLSIRRHGYTDIDLDQLVTMGMASRSIAAFLKAIVAAGMTVVISGAPGSGKTTTARAVLNTLPPTTQIATLETEDELGLHAMTDRHPLVWAGQEIPGGGEIVNGRRAGAFLIDDMLAPALRANAQVLVVGEVRGREIIAMLEAMQAGQNCVTTVHAKSGQDTVERLVTCAVQRGEVTTDWAYRAIASLVDVIVHIKMIDERGIGGRKHLHIAEIVLPVLSGDGAKFSVPALYKPGPDGRAIPQRGEQAAWVDTLALHGFDPTWLDPSRGGWDKPLDRIAGTQR